MNIPEVTLVLRLLLILVIGAMFVTDYFITKNMRELVATQEELIEAQKTHIEAAEKNIEIRKKAMGY